MRRFLLTFLTLALPAFAFAQDRQVKGTVVSVADGLALPGVSVMLKGTNNGTTTDSEGKFTLVTPASGGLLVFSFIGFASQEVEIGSQSELSIGLSEDFRQLSEVVITALGIEKSRQSLGYALQDVKGEQLAEARAANLVNGLSGKIAGVRISPSSGPGSGSNIQIRGQSSVSGVNQPLFVVDGVPMEQSQNAGKQFGGGMSEINPDNVASISVLKGPSATALYGSRGQNGVILINTKNGSGTKGISVEVNSNVMFERPAVKPDFQNTYGGGNGYRTWYTNGRSANITDLQEIQQYRAAYGSMAPLTGTDGTDESWGAPMDGRLVRHWWTGTEVAPLTPAPDNWDDYWETGKTITNNIAVASAHEKGSLRLSVGRLKQDGIMYNNDYWRNNLKLNAVHDFTDKFNATISAEYVKSGSDNRSYQDGQQFIWSHRQTDWAKLKDYEAYRGVHILRPGDGDAPNWQHTFFTNPFFTQDRLPYSNEKDRIAGNIALTYQVLPSLSLMLRSGTDVWTDTRINVINYERIRAGTPLYGQYSEEVLRNQETNTDVILTFNKALTPDFKLNVMAGGLLRTNYYKRNFTQVNQLVTDGIYTLANSIPSLNTVASAIEEKESQSIFGSASLGYRDALFLDLTARNDWSSTLPSTNWSYFYPSVTTSLILTELFDITPALSFGKVRASWAQVGNDTDPYRLEQLYYYGSAWNGSVPELYEGLEIANPVLKPEMTTGVELGFEARFLHDRVGIDFTYYDQSTEDQILAVEISKASGYHTRLLNAGEVTNKGVEVVLNATPVKLTNGLTWDISVNFARNRNKVVTLAEGLTTYTLNSRNSLASLAMVGQPYGALFGIGFEHAPDGSILYKDGLPVVSTTARVLGNTQPDWIGGLQNSISFKGISLSALIDIRAGGDAYNEGVGIARWTGQYAETAVGREEGIIGVGTMNIGSAESPQYVPNNVIVPARQLYAYNNARTYHEASIFDVSYVRLREVSLGYQIPSALLQGLFIKTAKISVVGRNLALLLSNVPHVDPEFDRLGGNSYGFGYGELPTTRSVGFNVNLTF